MSNVKPIPDGFHTATPYLVIRGTDRAIDFYKRAFGAEERMRMAGPDGKIVHAEIQIGDSIIMLSEEMPAFGAISPSTLNGTASSIFLYDKDVDALFRRAIAAGAKEVMAPQDQFWGDRFGKVVDPFGHNWAMATHKEDVSPEEMDKRHKAFVAEMSKQKGS
jgi:PhnB protein